MQIAYTRKLLRQLTAKRQDVAAQLQSLFLKERLITIKEKGFTVGSIVSWPAKGPVHVTGKVVEIDLDEGYVVVDYAEHSSIEGKCRRAEHPEELRLVGGGR